MTPSGYSVHEARPEDLAHLPSVEREASALFAGWGVDEGVLNDETSLDELRYAQQAGLLWVARGDGRELVGFALVELVDGQPHLEEIDVRPAHGRRGVGRALIETICSWAAAAGYTYVTLTTFCDIPWNAPFYTRVGFCSLAPAELTPGLEAIVRDEASRGLDPARRVVMRRDLGAA